MRVRPPTGDDHLRHVQRSQDEIPFEPIVARRKFDQTRFRKIFVHRRSVADLLRGFAGDIASDLDFATLERERALVRGLAVRRFGPGVAQRLAPVLEQLSDADRIVAVATGVIECETAEEFIARAQEVQRVS